MIAADVLNNQDPSQPKIEKDFGIKITEKAIAKARQILDLSDNKKILRFIARDGGCSGKKYDIRLDEVLEDTHQILMEIISNLGTMYKIVIDKNSLELLKNCSIDHISSDLEEKFVFSNPNAKSTCGCGESFN